jgi:DnaK suppressor protein
VASASIGHERRVSEAGSIGRPDAAERLVRPGGALYARRVNPDIERVLAEREQKLEDELAELTKPAGDLGTISFGKRVGEGTSMAVDRLTAVSAQQHLLAMLDEVRHARRRVADGSYGTCEVCGKPLPEERLEVRPWAVRCVQHS